MVAAETLGLPMGAIKLKIGDNSLPPSGASGGSTTIGGVSSSTRKATVNALDKLFEVVAPALGVAPDQLEAVDGRIQVKGNPAKSMTWEAACRKLGTKTISEMGVNDPRNPRGPEHRRRRRRADGRRFGGHRNRHRQDEQDRRGAGLRPGHQPQDRRKPGLRRLHHEHLRARSSKSASWTSRPAAC